jgi:hypothetical protein
LGALLAGAIALVVVRGGRRAVEAPQTVVDAGVDASVDAGVADAAADIPDDAEAPAGGTLLLSGEVPPPLAGDAPKSVVFGVILVAYRGAQAAPTSSRSRDAALELAKTLAEEAKTDFKAAVAKGDKGSTENAGRLPRGILEPAPEYVLFSLPKGGVSEPVDTPRGFFILQRIE